MNKVKNVKKYLWAVFAAVLLMTGIFASGKNIVLADGSCTGLLDPYWQRDCNDYCMLKENVKTQQQSVTMNGKNTIRVCLRTNLRMVDLLLMH